MKKILLPLFSLIILFGCTPKDQVKSTDSDISVKEGVGIAFYNVENLFDLEDDPDKPDDEFTPAGANKWTQERYDKKLNDLARVFDEMELPAIIGLAEVENKTVLQDLIKTKALRGVDYQIAHFESADYRGIDVALLYNPAIFKAESLDSIRFDFPDGITDIDGYTSRDVLIVEGTLSNGEPLTIFVNHWPSRRGGLAQSEPLRTFVAAGVKAEIDQLQSQQPSENILLMGDFNDEPDNKSIREVLNAQPYPAATYEDHQLYNAMWEIDQRNEGSYNFRGNWNMLDQIIVSGKLAGSDAPLEIKNPTVFQRPFMVFNHNEYGPTPNRTYGGPNYYGGISDHFPVEVRLIMK